MNQRIQSALTMPDQRIREILDEISAAAINPRIRELTAELGLILAQAVLDTSVSKKDADERFKTVGAIYRQLRRDLKQLDAKIQARDHNVAAKIHQFANHLMSIEMQVSEIADTINEEPDITRAKVVNGDDSALFGDLDEDATAT